MSSHHLDEAAESFSQQGYVVLENVLSAEQAAEALDSCIRTARRRNRIRVPVPYELLHRPPLRGIFREEFVWRNLVHLLGSAPASPGFCWFRICPPGGSSIDRIHRDRRTEPGTPVSISVDLMLTDFTRENGATEIWRGSQHTFDADPAAARHVEERLQEQPDRITGPAGSVVLRDQRAWHRGGVNGTRDPRCMFSSPGWHAV